MSWNQGAILWEGHARQLELLLAQLGFNACQPTATARVRPAAEEWAAAEVLPDMAATAPRRSAARLNYICQGPLDLGFSGKEGCPGMAMPTDIDFRLLKRCGRYLQGNG